MDAGKALLLPDKSGVKCVPRPEQPQSSRSGDQVAGLGNPECRADTVNACRQSTLVRFAAGVAFALLAGLASGTGPHEEQHAGHPPRTVGIPISCSPRAQVEFNHAVALLHHMTYPQAREAFEQVAPTDPQCAMAHRGVAMTLFQP